MFTIGDFAAMGGVSIRMLRHYDTIGLLRPAKVDEFSGYRYYEAAQLRRLNRLIALKELGFTLTDVAKIIDEKIDIAELRGMLRLRRAQVAEQIAADNARLVRIEARLRMIEKEGTMSTKDVSFEKVEPIRIASVSGVARSNNPEDVMPVIQPLMGQLSGALEQAGVEPLGAFFATYAPADGDGLTVTAACPVAESATADSVRIEELDGIEQAACYVHHGAIATIGEAYQILATWIEDNGYQTDGRAREVYVVSYPEPEERWQTKIQMPVIRP